MGGGTDLAKEASDIVILNDDFDSIVSGIRWGRLIMKNIRAFIMFQLVINVTALTVVAIAAFSKGTTPLNVVQLVYVNLVMDSFAAIGIATIPKSDDLMKTPPGPREQFVVTFQMLRSIVPQSLYQIACQLIIFFATPQLIDISDKQLSGFMFNIFIYTQIFNLTNVSSQDSVFPLLQMRRIRIIDICIVLMAGVQVVIMFFLGNVFKIDKITGNMWAISMALGFGSSVIHTIVTAAWYWVQD